MNTAQPLPAIDEAQLSRVAVKLFSVNFKG